MADYEYSFDPDDGNNTAASIYRLVRAGGPRVLDLGSGPGIVASYLTENDKKLVTCVDSSEAALAVADARGVDRIVQADLGDPSWVDHVAGESFDVIVMADVLEHQIDPRAVLAAIDEHSLLADGGHLVISIPNAAHEAVLAELINGRFTYQDTGLLDSTHLRFFTLASLRELLERSGFFVTLVERTHRTAEQTSLAVNDVGLPTELRDRILEAAPEAQTYQFIVRAEPAAASRELADLRRRLGETEAELHERERISARNEAAELIAERDAALARVTGLEADVAEARRDAAVHERRVAELEQALNRERKLTASERKRYEQAITAAKRDANVGELDAAKKETARLEKKLADVYQSRTWKVGRAAWTAAHVPARIIKRRRPKSAPVAEEPESTGPAEAVEYSLEENTEFRRLYQAAVDRRLLAGEGKGVAIAVYTDDLDGGRGDLYTAIGLGRHLEKIGYDVVYLPRDRWYDVPAGTNVYLAMLETVDVTQLPEGLTTVAWVRNQTAVWTEQPWLALYDMVLASSPLSVEALADVYPGPVGLLPIGVDTGLFNGDDTPGERHGVVSTVNQWGREREVFAYLKERAPEYPLALFGHQRGIAPELIPYAQGAVSFFALPSLYRQAQIVLDDFNHTTAGYGNVNSRLFEAAACGATVLTNRATGLDALDLGNILVFSSADELHDLVDRCLGREETEALQSSVLGDHSYQKRAQQFDAHLEALGDADPGDDRIVLSYYPDYRANPYMRMMWSGLRDRRGITMPVGDKLNFTATVRAADHRPTIFHVNWTAPILGGAVDEHDRLVRYRRFLEAIDEMHAKGIPSIWTVHNVMPHECDDPDLEAQLRQEIADRVDIVHVMCDETVAACAEWYEIPQSKVRVIPHPSYIDVYPNLVDRETARDELGLRPEDYVYLSFGQARQYKGIDRLLDAFEQVAGVDRDVKLLLAGKQGRFEGIQQINDRARANPKVISNLNDIPDADIQLYMNAADVVVLPYQAALNSGALLLAYSFARPVIAPDIGCLNGLVDDATGITFDPEVGTHALVNAMLAARDLGPEHNTAAYERASNLHYLDIGKRFAAMIDELL